MFLPPSWSLYIFGEVPVVDPQTNEPTGQWVNPLTYDVGRVVGGVFDFMKSMGIWVLLGLFVWNMFTKSK